MAPAQLRRWAGVKVGQNLLALDLSRVKRDLEMVPNIRTVAVERVLPNTLRLRLTEREPLAQICVPHLRPIGGYDTTVLQIDADGYVMPVLRPEQRAVPLTQTNEALPIISGLDPTQIVPGRRVDSLPAQSARLQLIAAFEESPMSGLVDLRRIDVFRARNPPAHHRGGEPDHVCDSRPRPATAPLARDL